MHDSNNECHSDLMLQNRVHVRIFFCFFAADRIHIFADVFFLSFPWQVPVPIPNERNFEKTHMFFSSLLRSFYAVFAYFVRWICVCMYFFASRWRLTQWLEYANKWI